MSAKQMGMVWEIDLPANQQSILLALADHADHDGAHARPSVALLAWKTGYSERQVRYILKAIRDSGLVEITSHGRGGRHHATEYQLHLKRGTPKAAFRGPDNPALTVAGNSTINPAETAPFNEETESETLQSETQTLQPGVGNPAIAVADEPSEPSENRIAVPAEAKKTPKPKKAAAKCKVDRPPDPLFNAIAEAWMGEPYRSDLLNEFQAPLVGKASAALRKVGARPEEVPAEWQRINAVFDNPSPAALAKHWKTNGTGRPRHIRTEDIYPDLN